MESPIAVPTTTRFLDSDCCVGLSYSAVVGSTW